VVADDLWCRRQLGDEWFNENGARELIDRSRTAEQRDRSQPTA